LASRGANQPSKICALAKWRSPRKITVSPWIRSRFPSEVEVSHINLNDGTVEDASQGNCQSSVCNIHPEAAPGPHDATYFFDQFAELIENRSSDEARITND